MEKVKLGEAERAETIGTECTADDVVNFKRMISELAEGNGDIENMGYSFFWSKTPQGHAYWESKLDKPEFTVEDKVYLRFLAGEYDELELVPYRGSAAEWVSYTVTVDRAPWTMAEALKPASFQAVDVSGPDQSGAAQMVDQRALYEAAVVKRMKESGFLEVEIRIECLARCDDGYQDEVINAGWHYWNAAIAAQPPQAEHYASIAEEYATSRPLADARPSERVLGRFEGEQAASGEIARRIRAAAQDHGGEQP